MREERERGGGVCGARKKRGKKEVKWKIKLKEEKKKKMPPNASISKS